MIGKIRELKLRSLQEGRDITEVLMHSRLIANGFLFLVEHKNNLYILLNENDFWDSIAWMPSETIKNLEEQILHIPVSRDSRHIMEVMGGIWKSAYATKSR